MTNNFVKEWRNIKGFEKFYKVSNYGEVRSKRRVVYGVVDGEEQPLYVAKEKTLTPFDNGFGYLVISLVDESGKRENRYVHRLVAEAFIPNPEGKPQVDHMDYDRKNNRVTNLRWVTVQENALHSLPNHPKIRNYCASSTGYKYIYRRGDKYRVGMKVKNGKRCDKHFDSLQDALNFRNHILGEMGVECRDDRN